MSCHMSCSVQNTKAEFPNQTLPVVRLSQVSPSLAVSHLNDVYPTPINKKPQANACSKPPFSQASLLVQSCRWPMFPKLYCT